MLLESLSTSVNETYVLYALSHMISSIPTAVLLNEIDNLYPLVMKAISSDKPELIIAGLKSFLIFVVQAKSKVENGFGSLVGIILKLVGCKESVDVRLLALQCLNEFSKYHYSLLYPYFERIMEAIDGGLDDPKRIVRAEVTKCKGLFLDLVPAQ
jgi:DNA repair/transcription protein MET18/MMS19